MTLESQDNKTTGEECGVMILTPSPLHNGGLWCAEKLPCKFHSKGTDGLSDVDRELMKQNEALSPATDDLVETLSAEIHKLYCKQYLQDHGEEYWTKGDYSKLEERVKEYDRNIARWHLEVISRTREEAYKQGQKDDFASGIDHWIEQWKKEGKEQGIREERERILKGLPKFADYELTVKQIRSFIESGTSDK